MSEEIPSFDFSSFYYPEILEALIVFKRRYVPELTDESEFETSIQLLRAFALVGHLNNVVTDMIANEATLPTARLAESVRNLLRLIDYEMKSGAPSAVDLVLKLSRVFSAPTVVCPARALFATKKVGGVSIPFESIEETLITPTNVITRALVARSAADVDLDADGFQEQTFHDFTTEANAATPYQVWATQYNHNALYFCHAEVMFDRIDLVLSTPLTEIPARGIWEFLGAPRQGSPGSVSDAGGTLILNLDAFFGSQLSFAQTVVVVRSSNTNAFETKAVEFDGTNNTVEVSYLGQTDPSLDARDYIVSVEWQTLGVLSDGTSGFTESGAVAFTLPQTEAQNWSKVEFQGLEAYWIRFRIVSKANPDSLEVGGVLITEGEQHVKVLCRQGRTALAELLGSSTGDVRQRFPMSEEAFISGTDVVRVNGETWIRVSNFLASRSQDKHYRIELSENNRAVVVFGDGVNGKIPETGQANIFCDYRFNAKDNGNVGPKTVTVDKTGLSFVTQVSNPRAGAGWRAADSESTETLERAKIEGPAALRSREVAISPSDVVSLATRYEDDNGSSFVARARAIEEGFGPKTTELVVVARGGNPASLEQLEELDLFFNGSGPGTTKRIVANQQVVSVNYTARPIDIEAILYVRTDFKTTSFLDSIRAKATNRMALVLRPEATENGRFIWTFGGQVAFSRLNHELFKTDQTVARVVLSTPSANIQLAKRELPALGEVSIQVQFETEVA